MDQYLSNVDVSVQNIGIPECLHCYDNFSANHLQFWNNQSAISDFYQQSVEVASIDKLHDYEAFLVFVIQQELNVLWNVIGKSPLLQS